MLKFSTNLNNFYFCKVKKKKEIKPKSIDELTKNFEEFIKDKELNADNKKDFEKLVEKAVKKKDK